MTASTRAGARSSRLATSTRQLWSAVISPRVALHGLLLAGGAVVLAELLPRLGIALTSEWSAGALLAVAGLTSLVHRIGREPQEVRLPRWTLLPAFASGLLLSFGILVALDAIPGVASWLDVTTTLLRTARRLVLFSIVVLVVEGLRALVVDRALTHAGERMDARPDWLSLRRARKTRRDTSTRG